ncbi:uncharacterized protein LOC114431816 [Parambassis ranga]|uniref:Uncharacterized protein LOC114431816 n=1 Tax=Parambassis ranga TaxID=210632 RepID=A0A6P7HXL1_9TELE|nr:uncharacterized protein LOC114431816 [Parambassis ranga]
MEAESEENHRRTVVVSGVPSVLPCSRMADKLTIHFQSSRRSHGGDVKMVKYPTNMEGVAFITFVNQEDAERVLMKEQQVMTDSEFPEDYRLTVFPFSRDVFLYVRSATVDLFVFGNKQASLVESLRSAHRSLRFQTIPEQRKAFIEGPLSAVLALREDLMLRASQLKSTVKLSETTLNPRVISHQRSVSSVSCSSSEAEQEPVGSSSLSLHSTGEPTEVQSLHSNAINTSSKQKAFCEDVGNSDKKKEVRAEEVRFSARDLPAGKDGHVSLKPSTRGERENHSGCRTDLTFLQAGLEAVCTQDQEDMWVDLYTFRYVKHCEKKELDRCLRGVDLSVECVDGRDLVRLSFSKKQKSEASRRIQKASENLQTLMEYWQSMLRVHEICYDKAEHPDEQKVTQVCEDVGLLFKDVLYMFEGSCIKVIGPPASSFLFYKWVEERIQRL